MNPQKSLKKDKKIFQIKKVKGKEYLKGRKFLDSGVWKAINLYEKSSINSTDGCIWPNCGTLPVPGKGTRDHMRRCGKGMQSLIELVKQQKAHIKRLQMKVHLQFKSFGKLKDELEAMKKTVHIVELDFSLKKSLKDMEEDFNKELKKCMDIHANLAYKSDNCIDRVLRSISWMNMDDIQRYDLPKKETEDEQIGVIKQHLAIMEKDLIIQDLGKMSSESFELLLSTRNGEYLVSIYGEKNKGKRGKSRYSHMIHVNNGVIEKLCFNMDLEWKKYPQLEIKLLFI